MQSDKEGNRKHLQPVPSLPRQPQKYRDALSARVSGVSYTQSEADYSLMCVCVLSRFSHVQLFVTLWTIAHQAALSMGFSRQEYWSGLLCPPAGDLPNPGPIPKSLSLLHWQVDSLPLAPPGKPVV